MKEKVSLRIGTMWRGRLEKVEKGNCLYNLLPVFFENNSINQHPDGQ